MEVKRGALMAVVAMVARKAEVALAVAATATAVRATVTEAVGLEEVETATGGSEETGQAAVALGVTANRNSSKNIAGTCRSAAYRRE